jgi:hypothetical protein
MAMEATKQLLKTYQRAVDNIHRVANEMELKGLDSANHREKAKLYSVFAADLEQALTEDNVLTEEG